MDNTYTESSNEIFNFFSACDEFIEGKFILADIKIAKILRSISESNIIYDLIAESLINYDFKKEYEYLQNESIEHHNGILTLPNNNQVIIPFAFSLLVEIDSKQINFNEFLAKEFPNATSQKEEYTVFANQIILPFKNAVKQELGFEDEEEGENDISTLVQKENDRIDRIEEEGEELEDEEDAEYLDEEDEEKLLFDRVSRMGNIINDKLIFINKAMRRSNVELLVNALQEACKIKNLTILIAIVMALNEMAYKEKKLRKELDEINNICLEFYN